MTPPDAEAAEHEQNHDLALKLIRAAQDNDVFTFRGVAGELQECHGWRVAAPLFARTPFTASEEIQNAFQLHWISSKGIGRENNRAVRTMLRVLLPPYHGPAVHLFRGTCFLEYRRRDYGFSWTTDPMAAEPFAVPETRGPAEGGAVVLETVAPPEAIISDLPYKIDGYDHEQEFVVDTARLGRVTIYKRLPGGIADEILAQLEADVARTKAALDAARVP